MTDNHCHCLSCNNLRQDGIPVLISRMHTSLHVLATQKATKLLMFKLQNSLLMQLHLRYKQFIQMYVEYRFIKEDRSHLGKLLGLLEYVSGDHLMPATRL